MEAVTIGIADLRRVAFEVRAVYMAFWALGTAAVAFTIWRSRRRER